MTNSRWVLIKTGLTSILVGYSLAGQAQQLIKGHIIDATTRKPLAYVNIGIKTKNAGAISKGNGSFSWQLPNAYRDDTLTFSLVGYVDRKVPINKLIADTLLTIQLNQRVLTLNEVNITGHKLVEKKFGIKNRSLLHFTDGMFLKQDNFEIGQAIKLGEHTAQITSVNLYINAPRKDSANFRINFYRLRDDRPTERLVEKSIIQRHAVREGWLTFDLRAYHLLLKGDFVVALELIPPKDSLASTPIYYEVKLGGSSRSFYRKNSPGQWNTPPHHYCLYLTALVDQTIPDSKEDEEAKPTFSYRSNFVQDSFYVFVHLPADYHKQVTKRFPVLYHLDGNAYFDHISSSLERLIKKKKLRVEPIVVGIGYRNAYVMDSLRVRDYTHPTALPSDSFPVSGGGEKFYRFLKDELIPEIEKRYRAEPTNRTLIGHSFGGYFALLALHKGLTEAPVFNQIVAASPSLSYHDNYLTKQFKLPSANAAHPKPCKLFLSFGELEMADYLPSYLPNFIQLLRMNSSLQIQPKLYKHLEHMGTAVPSFEEGIEFVLGK